MTDKYKHKGFELGGCILGIAALLFFGIGAAMGATSFLTLFQAKTIQMWELKTILGKQLFMVMFCGLGFVILRAVFFTRRAPIPKDGRIRMEGTSTHRYLLVMATVASVYVGILLWLAIPIIDLNDVPLWGYAPVALVVILIGVALYTWLQFKKYGVSVLELTPCPALTGQMMRGMVEIPCRMETEVEATLRFVHQYRTRRGGRQHTQTDTVWKESKKVPVYTVGENASAVKVEFEIGKDYFSTASRHQYGHWWELTLASTVKGINYRALFEIPVFNSTIKNNRRGR